MEKQFVTEQLRTKWAPVLEHADMPAISDDYRKNVTAILLENQEQYLKEAAPANFGSGLAAGADTNAEGISGLLWYCISFGFISKCARACVNVLF